MRHNLVTLFHGAEINTRKQHKNNVQCRQMKMVMWNKIKNKLGCTGCPNKKCAQAYKEKLKKMKKMFV